MKLGHLQNVSLAILMMILQAVIMERCNEFNGAHLNNSVAGLNNHWVVDYEFTFLTLVNV